MNSPLTIFKRKKYDKPKAGGMMTCKTEEEDLKTAIIRKIIT